MTAFPGMKGTFFDLLMLSISTMIRIARGSQWSCRMVHFWPTSTKPKQVIADFSLGRRQRCNSWNSTSQRTCYGYQTFPSFPQKMNGHSIKAKPLYQVLVRKAPTLDKVARTGRWIIETRPEHHCHPSGISDVTKVQGPEETDGRCHRRRRCRTTRLQRVSIISWTNG